MDWIKMSRRVRYPIALLLLVMSILALIFRWYVDRTEVTEVDTNTVTTTTLNAPTLTSTITLAVVLLIVALLLPDLSELNVFGVALKMKVEAVEKEAQNANAHARAAQSELQELRIELVRVSASASASAHNSVQVNLGDLRENLRDALEGVALTSVPRVPDATHREALIGKIITGWENLSSILGVDGRLQVGVSLSKDPLKIRRNSARYQFVRQNELQLQTVREIRNAAAHPTEEVRDDDLEDGARLLAYLLDSAGHAINNRVQ